MVFVGPPLFARELASLGLVEGREWLAARKEQEVPSSML